MGASLTALRLRRAELRLINVDAQIAAYSDLRADGSVPKYLIAEHAELSGKIAELKARLS